MACYNLIYACAGCLSVVIPGILLSTKRTQRPRHFRIGSRFTFATEYGNVLYLVSTIYLSCMENSGHILTTHTRHNTQPKYGIPAAYSTMIYVRTY